MKKLFLGVILLATAFLPVSGCNKSSSPPGPAMIANADAFKAMLQICREFRPTTEAEVARNAPLNIAFRKLIEFKRSSDPAIREEAWRTMIWIQTFCPGPEFTADQWTEWLGQIEARYRA